VVVWLTFRTPGICYSCGSFDKKGYHMA